MTAPVPTPRATRAPEGQSVLGLIRGLPPAWQLAARAAFVSALIYRYGRWALARRNPVARWFANKLYAVLKVMILNVTKVWILRRPRSARTSTSSTRRDPVDPPRRRDRRPLRQSCTT
jgi:hypothetical protein